MINGSKGNMKSFDSGSIKNWRHSPNLTPRGFEIKKDELYVLNGDVLIKAYHLLMNQRASSLMTLSNVPPTDAALYEEYLSLSKYINMVLHHILNSLPLASVLDMQDQRRINEEKQTKNKNKNISSGLTLKEILDKFHLSEGGKDELKPPSPPIDGEPTNE